MKRYSVHAFKLLLCVAVALLFTTLLLDAAKISTQDLKLYLDTTIQDTGSLNVVTAILMDYRGFDTLGEATVIFTSVTAISIVLGKPFFKKENLTLSLLARRALSSLLPFFFLFSVYVITYGHLSPGGGFQGGVSLAVLLILIHVTFGNRFAEQQLPLGTLRFIEYSGALLFVSTGFISILMGANYLSNLATGVPPGTAGMLFSAGLIPFLNILVGIKVAAGLGCSYLYLAGYHDEKREIENHEGVISCK